MPPCPGCSLFLPPSPSALPDPRFHSSRECWDRYAQLAARTLSLSDPSFPHQHAVDCYEAQHIGPTVKPIVAPFALLGLCLSLEHNYTGRQVQQAHIALGNLKRDWPRLEPSNRTFSVTVNDVVQAEGEGPRRAALQAWMQATWAAWSHEQSRIRSWTKELII